MNNYESLWRELQTEVFYLISTQKVIYYSMFHSHLQNSLLNWGRSFNSYLSQPKNLQNKVLKTMFFLSDKISNNFYLFQSTHFKT